MQNRTIPVVSEFLPHERRFFGAITAHFDLRIRIGHSEEDTLAELLHAASLSILASVLNVVIVRTSKSDARLVSRLAQDIFVLKLRYSFADSCFLTRGQL